MQDFDHVIVVMQCFGFYVVSFWSSKRTVVVICMGLGCGMR